MWGITSVQWGITSVLWRVFSTVGGTFSTVGDNISTVGDNISTVEVAQYSGDKNLKYYEFSKNLMSFRFSDCVPLIFPNQSLFEEFQGIT